MSKSIIDLFIAALSAVIVAFKSNDEEALRRIAGEIKMARSPSVLSRVKKMLSDKFGA